MLRKVSYLLSLNSVMNMVCYISLDIGRENFHLRSFGIMSLRRKILLPIGLLNFYVPISKAIASQYV
jgi:hypothetical protein